MQVVWNVSGLSPISYFYLFRPSFFQEKEARNGGEGQGNQENMN